MTSKFYEQCGHRLPENRRQKKSKNQKQETQLPTNPLTSASSNETSDNGWFWGAGEQSRATTRAICAVQHEELHSEKFPSKHPFVTAHTASSRCRSPHEAAQPLRRICSLGQASFLPALSQAPPKGRHDDDPPFRQKAPTKPALVETPKDIQASNPCGVLWGHVLAEVIAEFESKTIILTVEIDSDEQCMCVLTQKLHIEEAARSKYVVMGGISPLRFKLNELKKKVRMNKEKLAMVRQRLVTLYEQHEREEGGSSVEQPSQDPQELSTLTKRDNRCEGSHTLECKNPPAIRTKKRKLSVPVPATSRRRKEEVDAAAILIQKRFRMLRARHLFAEMVKRAYQRVFDPDTKHYFYYDSRTRQSQWEAPPTLVHANVTMARRQSRRTLPSARSLHTAASRIQALYRRRAARRAMRELLSKVYEKVYVRDSDSYYYYCATTKSSSWEKPKLLREDDVPITRASKPVAQEPSRSINSTQDAAATTIQMLFRNRATRQFIRDLATGAIEKHFDIDAQAWYYFNTRTQQSFWEQPRHASLTSKRT